MSFAKKKAFCAPMLASVLIAGYAGTASSMQMAPPGGVPPLPDGAPSAPPAPSPAPQTGSSYFAQHFNVDVLPAEVKTAVVQANLAPVPFKSIVVHTRDQVTTSGGESGQGNPSSYTATIVLENAGHGLIRRMQVVQSKDGNSVTRFDLTYRGYFPFLLQTIPANANALPPTVQARKLLHFDTHTEGHMSFAYQYGASGQAAFADPGQVICDAGNSYDASQLNPAIQGQARELNCQTVDTNGIVTDKIKLAYLEKYQVALVLHTQNPESSLDSTIVDFTVE
jgi:hypothetical protein